MGFLRPGGLQNLRERFAEWRRTRKETRQRARQKEERAEEERRLGSALMSKTTLWQPPVHYIPLIREWDPRLR